MAYKPLDHHFPPQCCHKKRTLDHYLDSMVESSSFSSPSEVTKGTPARLDTETHQDQFNSLTESQAFFSCDSPEVASIPYRTPTETSDRLEDTISTVTSAMSRQTFPPSSRTVGRTTNMINDRDQNKESESDYESETSDFDSPLKQLNQCGHGIARTPEARIVSQMEDDSEKETTESEDVKSMHKNITKRIAHGRESKMRLRESSAKKVMDTTSPKNDEVFARKNLRKRTLIQERPYQADKVRHQKSQKSGAMVNDAEVEKAIRATQRNTSDPATKAAAKVSSKPRETERFSSVSTAASISSSSAVIVSDPDTANKNDEEHIMRNTTLWVRLEGGDNSAVPIQLSECPNLTTLFHAIEKTWGSHSDKKATQVQVFLPWKIENNTILMKHDWESVWRIMMDQILRAPVWRKGTKGEGVLEVRLLARLE